MWNNTGNSFEKTYQSKNISDWDGNDCYIFSNDVLEGLHIPSGIWLNRDAFQFMVGNDFLHNKSKEYVGMLGEEYGKKFYQAVKTYLKSRKTKGKTKRHLSNVVLNENSLDCNNWAVPQSHLSVDDFTNGRSMSPLMRSYTPEYNANFAPFEEQYQYNISNFNTPNCFTGIPIAENSFDEEVYSPYSIPNQFSPPPSSYQFQLTSPTEEPGNSFSGHLQDTAAYVGSPSSGSYGFFPDCSSLTSADIDLGIETLMEDINIDTYDYQLDELDELEIYIPEQSQQCLSPKMQIPELPNIHAVSEAIAISPTATASGLHDKMLQKIVTGKRKNRTRHPRSWEFLVRLLIDPQTNPSLIKWEDKERGTFRFMDKDEIARLWGSRTERHKKEPLSYDNFARILRYHYKHSGMLKAVSETHLVYQLGDKVLENLRKQNIL